MIEVEIKLELSQVSRHGIKELLSTMNFVKKVKNQDIYYDTEDFDLLRQAVFLRVRNQQSLEIKFQENASWEHLYCREYAFPLQPSAKQAEILNAVCSHFLPSWYAVDTVQGMIDQNRLKPLVHINNERSFYRSGNVLVCVDNVQDLGEFIEIEIQCQDESEVSQAKMTLERLASSIAARRKRIGYVELWLQKYQPQVYVLGKYQEPVMV